MNNLGFSNTVPIKSKSQAGNALTEIFDDKGLPTVMLTDDAKEFKQGCWQERDFISTWRYQADMV